MNHPDETWGKFGFNYNLCDRYDGWYGPDKDKNRRKAQLGKKTKSKARNRRQRKATRALHQNQRKANR